MNRAANNRSNNRNITALCSVIFLSFSFIWLYKGEGEALRCLLHTLSDGKTIYSPLWGALIITISLWLIQWSLNMLMRFRSSLAAMAFFPAYLVLALLSCIGTDTRGDSTHFAVRIANECLWGGLAAFFLYLVAGFFNRKLQKKKRGKHTTNVTTTNLLILIAFTYITGFVGNTNEVFHNELAVAQSIREGNFDKALQKGIKSPHHSHTLTALRSLALSHTNALGENLFAYPQTDGANGLFLNESDGKVSTLTNNDICNHLRIRHKREDETVLAYLDSVCYEDSVSSEVMDYHLCALLLEKKLDAFRQTLSAYYSTKKEKLPRHYQEALLLNGVGEETKVDSITSLRFEEFKTLRNQYTDSIMQNNFVRRQFGNTYWWYYYYGKKIATNS